MYLSSVSSIIFVKYQERRIQALESLHDVKISVNKAKAEVKLEGGSDALHNVVPIIYNIVMEVKDKEKQDRELELLAKQVMLITLNSSIYFLLKMSGRVRLSLQLVADVEAERRTYFGFWSSMADVQEREITFCKKLGF